MSRQSTRRSLSLGLALVAGLALAAGAQAQEEESIEDRITTLAADNARLYSHPVSSGFAAGLSSGWFSSARPMDVLGIEVSVRASGSLIPDDDTTFEPVLPETAELDGQTFSDPYRSTLDRTPTAAGAGPGTVLEPRGEFRDSIESDPTLQPEDFEVPFPEGFDIPAVPMAVLQGSVGLPLATEATLRFIPSIELHPDVGSVSSFGAGLKHSVSQWFPGEFPLDVAVEGGFQSFDVGDYVSASAQHYSLIVSRDVGLLTLYGSGGVESSEVDVSYTFEPENPDTPGAGSTIAFTDEGDNSSRLTLGFNLDLLFLQMNAGYTLAEYDVLNAGVGFRF